MYMKTDTDMDTDLDTYTDTDMDMDKNSLYKIFNKQKYQPDKHITWI